MKAAFSRGDAVKLTDRLAATLNAGRVQFDWRKRRGIVRHCNATSVHVVWGDNRSAESLPLKAIERI